MYTSVVLLYSLTKMILNSWIHSCTAHNCCSCEHAQLPIMSWPLRKNLDIFIWAIIECIYGYILFTTYHP